MTIMLLHTLIYYIKYKVLYIVIKYTPLTMTGKIMKILYLRMPCYVHVLGSVFGKILSLLQEHSTLLSV